jgi:hypothetical protein
VNVSGTVVRDRDHVSDAAISVYHRVTAFGMTSKSTRPRLRDSGCADDFVRATVATIIMIVIIQRLDQPRVTTGVVP